MRKGNPERKHSEEKNSLNRKCDGKRERRKKKKRRRRRCDAGEKSDN